MCFEGRAGGESVGLTMPLLAWKGYREAQGRALCVEPMPAILRRTL